MDTRPAVGDACERVGLAFACTAERITPRYELSLSSGGDGPQPATLSFRVRDVADVALRVVDVDEQRRGLLLEVSVKTVRQEPTFDLWLEGEERERYLVARDEEACWTLRSAEGSASVADALADDDDDDGRPEIGDPRR